MNMTINEILIKVKQGEIDLEDVKRSRDLAVIAFDKSINAGYLGFVDGKILQVSSEKYSLYYSLGMVMTDSYRLYDVTSKFNENPREKVNSILKIVKRITDENKKYEKDQRFSSLHK